MKYKGLSLVSLIMIFFFVWFFCTWRLENGDRPTLQASNPICARVRHSTLYFTRFNQIVRVTRLLKQTMKIVFLYNSRWTFIPSLCRGVHDGYVALQPEKKNEMSKVAYDISIVPPARCWAIPVASERYDRKSSCWSLPQWDCVRQIWT